MRAHKHTDERSLIVVAVAAALLSMFFLQGFVFAQTVPSSELISKAKEYDGKTVSFEGEVIGDVMQRGDFVWVNVHDGTTAIGIWMSKDFARSIAETGGYRKTGDRVSISGVFHQHCPEHGADLDIHADGLQVIARGMRLAEEPHVSKSKLALGFGIALGVLWILSLLNKR
ncbi:MAG: DNA-binding protein [Candidatus Omnitrophica bacterium]|nr:DNA-binding protein [Candidatus Omnitrophota bacterium]